MTQIAPVAFETSDLIAALWGEVEEIVTLIARPVGRLLSPPALAPAPTQIASTETGGDREGRVLPA